MKILVIVLGTLCILILIYTCLQIAVQDQVESQMGFHYETPEEDSGEVFIITEVKPGKIMDKAGMREGDYILMNSVPQYYYRLIFNQNKDVYIPIKRDRQFFDIKVHVPTLKLMFSMKIMKILYWFDKDSGMTG
jgi:hypothetical protein